MNLFYGTDLWKTIEHKKKNNTSFKNSIDIEDEDTFESNDNVKWQLKKQ